MGRFAEAAIEFMRAVVAAIDQADSSAWMVSDDLLQSGQGFGGLYDEVNGRYGFEFLVGDPEEDFPTCWYFDLDRQAIRDIATGKVTQVQLWRCAARDCGRRFPTSDYYCEECDFPPE